MNNNFSISLSFCAKFRFPCCPSVEETDCSTVWVRNSVQVSFPFCLVATLQLLDLQLACDTRHSKITQKKSKSPLKVRLFKPDFQLFVRITTYTLHSSVPVFKVRVFGACTRDEIHEEASG